MPSHRTECYLRNGQDWRLWPWRNGLPLSELLSTEACDSPFGPTLGPTQTNVITLSSSSSEKRETLPPGRSGGEVVKREVWRGNSLFSHYILLQTRHCFMAGTCVRLTLVLPGRLFYFHGEENKLILQPYALFVGCGLTNILFRWRTIAKPPFLVELV